MEQKIYIVTSISPAGEIINVAHATLAGARRTFKFALTCVSKVNMVEIYEQSTESSELYLRLKNGGQLFLKEHYLHTEEEEVDGE